MKLPNSQHERTRVDVKTLEENPQVSAPTLDFNSYAPAYLTLIANKLSHGASIHYLKFFGVGIEAWRALATIAVSKEISAAEICQQTSMNKASVSRVLKLLQNKNYIKTRADSQDSRIRIISLTKEGQDLHDRMIHFALHREQALLSVLSQSEQKTFIKILKRVCSNMDRIDKISQDFVDTNWK